MKKISIIAILLCAWSLMPVAAQTVSETYKAYIEKYYELAQEQQKEFGVPASITLAQGLLESAAGRSELATKANNHFGIKCTSDWKGGSYNHDDDAKDECFRKYKKVEESFVDHSLFLKRARYQSLFTLDVTDYKGWAHGLKRCGYATDPGYAGKLIQLIETYDLARYSILSLDYRDVDAEEEKVVAEVVVETPVASDTIERPAPNFQTTMGTLDIMLEHEVFRNNGSLLVIAREGDTFLSIAAEFNMYESTLRRYNDIINPRYELRAGDKVYLQLKRKKAEKRFARYRVKRDENIWQIAQDKGMRLKTIYELNGIEEGQNVTINQLLKLR